MNNNYSRTILWLGLIMILFQVAKDWAQIKQALFVGGKSVSGSYPPSQAPPIPHTGPIPLPILPLPGGHNLPLPVL